MHFVLQYIQLKYHVCTRRPAILQHRGTIEFARVMADIFEISVNSSVGELIGNLAPHKPHGTS